LTYASEDGNLSVALTGECMLSRPLKPFGEPGFAGLRTLLHSADVRFSNSETLFHDYQSSPGHLHVTYMRCDPRLLEDLQCFGINLLSCANNHGHDYSEGAVLENIHNSQSGSCGAGTRWHRPKLRRSRGANVS
jgi:poly-gamma-glutamate synthesis protein (capsule biosynthesis protein)